MGQQIAKAPSSKKVRKVMGEFKDGKLKSSSGDKVTNPKQAIAIALSEARMKEGGRVKPLYERPRPEGLKRKTMTPAEKVQAAKIAKGDKKVGLFARINAMRKVK